MQRTHEGQRAGAPVLTLDPALVARARTAADGAADGDLSAALDLARDVGRSMAPPPADLPCRLGALAALGAADLTVARVVEPHLDALAILAEAGDPVPDAASSTWGVYAAHAPGAHLDAAQGRDGWTLTGTKRWCSLATRLDRAVVTAHTSPTTTRAFALDLRGPGVRHEPARWVSRGLTEIRTGSLELSAAPVVPVGEDGWYVGRPGFAVGGVGVAAVWFGAARALGDALARSAHRRDPDQIALAHLGDVDRLLWSAELALTHAAQELGEEDGSEPAALVAARTRAVVADVAERAVRAVGHALGPAPLTHDEEHARRVADLTVYVRQHHAERDLARLGELVRAEGPR